MKKVVQLTILMLIVTFLPNISFAEQNRNELLRGIWKSNTGSIVRIDGNQGVLIETPSESWEQYINKPIIKNIRPKYDGWTVNELIKVIDGFQWIEITWELVDNKIHKRLLYLKSEEKNYYEKIDNEISAKEKKSYLPSKISTKDKMSLERRVGIGARVGYMNYSDDDIGDVNVEFDDSMLYGINSSYFFTKYFSLELSVEHTKTDVDLGSSGIFLNFGEISQTPVMLTAHVHFSTETNTVPYLGVGVGYFFNSFDFSSLVDTALAQTNTSGVSLDPDDSFGYHINGGLEFFLSKSAAFNIDLKYIWNSVDFDLKAPGYSTETYEVDMNTFVVGLGIKFYF